MTDIAACHPYLSALALGAVCGARTMMGPALLAPLAPRWAGWLLRALAAGELVGDKLPQTPSRLEPGGLGARFVTGAIVGAIVCRRAGKGAAAGALLGAGAALLCAKLGHDGRAALGVKLGLPDPAVAVVEDALVIGTGRLFAPVP